MVVSLKKLQQAFENIDLFYVVGILTMLLLVLRGPDEWFNVATYQIALVIVCLRPNILYCWQLWLVMSVTTFLWVVQVWWWAPNHMWLLWYWTISLTLATFLFSGQKERLRDFLGHNARWLIIGIMFFAVVQKTISPDYLNGSFFEFAFLFDEVFTVFTNVVIGISMENIAVLHEQFESAPYRMSSEGVLSVVETSAMLTPIALVITYVNYLFDIIICVLFWLKRGTLQIAHQALIVFILTVYSIAPFYTFGWLLAIFGIATLTDENKKYLVWYVLSMVALTIYDIPWGPLVETLFTGSF